jgi:hypothetical protein
MKPMLPASEPWSCRNKGRTANTPKWPAVHSKPPLVSATTLRVSVTAGSAVSTAEERAGMDDGSATAGGRPAPPADPMITPR